MTQISWHRKAEMLLSHTDMPMEVLALVCDPDTVQEATGRTVPLLAVAGSPRYVCSSLRFWRW